MVGEYYLASLPDRGGRITVESVAECSWTGWQNARGIGGRMVMEYALHGRVVYETRYECKKKCEANPNGSGNSENILTS